MQLQLQPSPLPDAMLPAPYRVTTVRRENHDTFTLTLAAATGKASFAFKPGQFNMLYVHGVGEVPISISGDPARADRIVHTIRAVGVATQAMRNLRRGDVVGLRGPFGTEWPIDAARGRDLVIVAGGIGLAPLRPALLSVLGPRRTEFGRISLLYGARTPDDLLFMGELEQWRRRDDIDVHVTVDRGSDAWRGQVGVVTTLIPMAAFDAARSIALICGPEIMMRFTVKSLQSKGVPDANIYISMERNMKCAVGFCGHCQFGPEFICKDGPVFSYARIGRLLTIREL